MSVLKWMLKAIGALVAIIVIIILVVMADDIELAYSKLPWYSIWVVVAVFALFHLEYRVIGLERDVKNLKAAADQDSRR